MYEELVKQLKDKAGGFEYDGWVDTAILLSQAADAIEELSMRLHGDQAAIAGMKREIERMIVNAPRWIPVTERLPEEWKSVLTYQPYVGDEEKPLMRVSWYIGAGSWRECEQANKLELPVTHWMPLPNFPEPPKEGT